MKIVIAIDSFKGCMSSLEAAGGFLSFLNATLKYCN